jgi:uncharacterized protein (DUF433 family)
MLSKTGKRTEHRGTRPVAVGAILKYSEAMSYSDIITLEPGKRGGKPCIRGLRVTVYDVLEYLASGMSHSDILRELPFLNEKDILACLAYAADRERKLEISNA